MSLYISKFPLNQFKGGGGGVVENFISATAVNSKASNMKNMKSRPLQANGPK